MKRTLPLSHKMIMSRGAEQIPEKERFGPGGFQRREFPVVMPLICAVDCAGKYSGSGPCPTRHQRTFARSIGGNRRNFGRDILARVIDGASVSLLVAVSVVWDADSVGL